MIETPTAVAPAKGLFARVIGVITSPRATYEAIVARPRAMGVLMIATLAIGLSQTIPSLTERGREAAFQMQVKQTEAWTGPLSQEALNTMRERSKYNAYFALPGTLVGMTVACLFFGAIYWVTFNTIMGGTATFKQVYAVVCHSLVIAALGAVLGAPIQYMQGTMTAAGPFNLGMLVPMLDETSFVFKAMAFTSVFTIWGFLNTGTGLGVLFKRNGTTIGLVLTAIYLVLVFGGFAIFS
jgi:hypothetical protein